MSLDFAATIFSGDNGTGISRVIAGGNGNRSDGDDSNELIPAGLWRNIQSFQLSTSSETDANIVFCKWNDYSGPFAQVALGKGGGLGLFDCSGTIGSVYTVATHRNGENEIRQSARQLLEAQWIAFLDAKLANSQASRVGGPTIRWRAFPRIDFLDQKLVYVEIHQPLHIAIDWWPDYAASITYHLFPFVDAAGHVRVFGARWGFWVEDGAKKGKISDALRPKVSSGLGQLVNKVNTALFQFDALGKVREVYLLPGNQVGVGAGDAAFSGNADSDATVVVVV